MKKSIYVLSLILFFSCGKNNNEKEAQKKEAESTDVIDKSTPVKALRLDYSDFTHDLIANGTLAAQSKADLRFQTNEQIAAIHVKNGDKVHKGQKIAELDRFKLENSLLQAKDNFERAKLELQDVLIGQGYMLRDSSAIPPEVMALAKIRSNYDQNDINYKIAQSNLNNAVLTAPFDGIAANLYSKVYNYPDNSQPFCTIINNRFDADFNILEVELPFIKKGDEVLVSPYAVDNFTVSGLITEINPVVDKNGMVRVKASINPHDGLYEGMNVRILIQQKMDRRLVIPKEALVLRNNRKVVFTLKNNQANWVYVETGLENSYGYVITDNSLQIGDSIIYDGNINLAHESRVTVVR